MTSAADARYYVIFSRRRRWGFTRGGTMVWAKRWKKDGRDEMALAAARRKRGNRAREHEGRGLKRDGRLTL